MLSEIKLPKLGETMEYGIITRWLVSEGDLVNKGQPIFEVQTDKANIEYESPAGGTLLKILAPAELSIPVLAIVAYLGEPGDEIPAQTEQPVQARPIESTAVDPPLLPAIRAEGKQRIKPAVSPRARKLAGEAGMDPADLAGSGPGGRVVAKDVEALLGRSGERADRRAPMTRMRRLVAKRLTESFTGIPHFYLQTTADVSDLVGLRTIINDGSDTAGDNKISVTDLILRACALALKEFPELNASVDGDDIILHGQINLGVAVSIDDGLAVPVVKEADRLSLKDLSYRVKGLVDKARQGKLAPDECSGGTFTVTNLGMYGVDEFCAIINPPEAAILAVGRAVPRVMPVGPGFQVRQMMTLTLSCDHRVIDGALGGKFLAKLRKLLEAPYKLVI